MWFNTIFIYVYIHIYIYFYIYYNIQGDACDKIGTLYQSESRFSTRRIQILVAFQCFIFLNVRYMLFAA